MEAKKPNPNQIRNPLSVKENERNNDKAESDFKIGTFLLHIVQVLLYILRYFVPLLSIILRNLYTYMHTCTDELHLSHARLNAYLLNLIKCI